MSALSDLLNQAIKDRFPEGPSNRQVARMAGISRGTVDNYLNGVVVRPTESVLQAFHTLLAIPIQDLRAVAGLPRGEAEPYAPPAEANLLTRRQRETLDAFIRAVVDERGETYVDQHNFTHPPAEESGTQGSEDEDQKTGLSDEDQAAVDRIRATNKKVRRNTASDEAEGA